MNNLTATEQDRYNVLQSKILKASSGLGEPLSEPETEEFKSLTERIKPSSVKIDAAAQLTPDEQDRYKALQTKANAALGETGPPLSPAEKKEYDKLYTIDKFNKNKNDNGSYGGRRSKKAPHRRRRRSSKARKARKSRTTRRR